jgi:hypothetical protein
MGMPFGNIKHHKRKSYELCLVTQFTNLVFAKGHDFTVGSSQLSASVVFLRQNLRE